MSEEQTRIVVRRHLAAWQAGDVLALLSDYAEDAVLLSKAGGVVAGKQAIGAMFAMLYQTLFPPQDTALDVTAEIISGNHALVHWQATTSAIKTTGAFDSFVLRDGLIIAQCGGADIEPRG